MLGDMKKLMQKKEDDSSNPAHGEAKLSALKDLRKMASDMMGESLKDGMSKKVVVAAKDQAGLEKGLDKAKEIVSSNPKDIEMPDAEANDLGDDMAGVEDSPEEEAMESDAEAKSEKESPEEIDKMIAALQEKKKKLMSR